jgi:histidinol phosphatase-like PHP family hydrolase
MSSLPHDVRVRSTPEDLGTVAEMVRAAEASRLECVVLAARIETDTSREALGAFRAHVDALDAQSAVRAIPGLEATILDPEGAVTVTAEDARGTSLVIAGLGARTRGIGQDPPASSRRFADNVLGAMIEAAANPVVDVLATPFGLGLFEAVLTPGQFSPASLRRVARALFEHNVACEIHNRIHAWYPQMTVDEFTEEYVRLLRLFSDEGVKFVVGSGTRAPEGVGNLRYCRHLMNEAGIERSELVDIARAAQVRARSLIEE